jgi:predicted Zn finger-like uncharacterized protein
VIIECTNCHSKYQYDEDRFEGKGAKKIKCAKCQQIFEIHNPKAASPALSTPPPAAPARKQDVGDSTFHRREDRARLEKQTEEPANAPPPVKQSAGLQMPQGRRLSLAIIDGPDAGSVFRIEKPRVTIGRTGADLNLNDTEASRQHAAVEVRESDYRLLDLGSTNGTLMEGQKISEPTELQNHSEFVVGVSTLMLIVTEEG